MSGPSTRRRLYVILLQALCLPRTRSVRGTAFLDFPINIKAREFVPISLGLWMLGDSYGAECEMRMAASMSMILPVVLLFFFAQRYFIQGVTLTGLKG